MGFDGVQVVLPHHRGFPLYKETTECQTGWLYEHNYHGHKRFLHANNCGELFTIKGGSGKKILSYVSRNESLWDTLRGRLLSLDVTCVAQKVNFSSCFLFQVEGKYAAESQGVVMAGKGSISSPCPSVKPPFVGDTLQTSLKRATTTSDPITATTSTPTSITTERSTTSTQTTKQSATSLESTSTVSFSPSLPWFILSRVTKGPTSDEGAHSPTKVTVVYVKDTLTGTTIGVLTGLGTGIAIVMVCIIIWIFVKKRTNIFKTPPRLSGNIFNPQSTTGTLSDWAGYHYDVPNAQPIPLLPRSSPPLQTPLVLTATTVESRAYTSRRNPAMSIRPLPENNNLSTLERQYSYIGDRNSCIDDPPDYKNQENVVLLNSEDLTESVGYGRQYSSITEQTDQEGYEEPVKSFEEVAGFLSHCGSTNICGANRRDISCRPPSERGNGREYSYISTGKCENVELGKDYDGCGSLASRCSSKIGGSMSNRPLPEKPMESVNQYYSVVSVGSDKNDKVSEGNDLYSLYSTIDDLQ